MFILLSVPFRGWSPSTQAGSNIETNEPSSGGGRIRMAANQLACRLSLFFGMHLTRPAVSATDCSRKEQLNCR